MTIFNPLSPIGDPDLFAGREGIRTALSESPRSTVVLGEARVGKSSLLLQLKRELARLGPDGTPRIATYLNLRSPSFRSPADIYTSIAASLLNELRLTYNLKVSKYGLETPGASGLLQLLDTLATVGVRVEVISLIDDLDRPEAFLSERELLYSGLRQILDFSPSRLPVTLIASAALPFLALESTMVSKLCSRLDAIVLGALSRRESLRLIAKCPLFDEDSDILKEYLADQTGGHPCVLQELLARFVRGFESVVPLQELVKRECADLAERGATFFAQYIDELSYQDVIHLLAIAFQTDGDYHPPPSTVKRFVSAGLVREVSSGIPEASCKLFFQWFRFNVNQIFPGLAKRRPTSDPAWVASLLQRVLRTAVGRSPRVTEEMLQDVTKAILKAADLSPVSEAPLKYKGKTYRVDFALPELESAVEIKLAKTARQVGALIDELQADLDAYQSCYRNLIVVIYDLSASSRLTTYVAGSRNPFVRYVLIRHDDPRDPK